MDPAESIFLFGLRLPGVATYARRPRPKHGRSTSNRDVRTTVHALTGAYPFEAVSLSIGTYVSTGG